MNCMHRLLSGCFCFALAMACVVFAGGSCAAEAKQLYVEIDADGSEVVVPAGASPVVSFAAEEMNGILNRAFGRKLPVVQSPTAGRTSIFLGDCEESRAAGIDVSKLGYDAFAIQAGGNRVFIAGRDDPKRDIRDFIMRGIAQWIDGERATLFGVYDFLERYAGVRFYFPGKIGTVVPKTTSFRVAEGRVVVEPAFTVRSVCLSEDGPAPGNTNAAAQKTWKSLDHCRLRMQTRSVPCCHGQRGFSFPERFHKTHPEYFALMKDSDGNVRRKVVDHLEDEWGPQMCHTSGLWDEMYLDCKAFLTGEPASTRGVLKVGGKGEFGWNRNFKGRFVDVMPGDAMKKCLCENCEKTYVKDSRQWATELVWGNTARLAQRLMDDGIDCIVTQMAYPPSRDVPRCSLPSNIWVMVAETGPWAEACPGEPERETDEVRRWTEKLGHKIWMWTYPSKYGEKATPGVPDMAPRAWGKFYKRTLPYSYGAYCESEGEKAIFHYLNYYVFSRIAWDANVDVEAVLAEHFDKMFGPAAEELACFYADLEEKWTKSVMFNWHESSSGMSPCTSPDVRLWRNIYTPAVLDGWSRLFDRAEAKAKKDPDSLTRVRFIRQEFLDYMIAASRKFIAESDPEAARRRYRSMDPAVNLLPPQTEPRHLVVTNAGGQAAFNVSLKDKLKPNTRYRLSGIFKLKDVEPLAPSYDGGCYFDGYVGRWEWFPKRVARFSGTVDWTYREYEFTTPAVLKQQVGHFVGFILSRGVGEAWMDCMALEELGPAVDGK